MRTVKEYLSQLRTLDLHIQARRYEIEQLKILATCTGSVSNPDKLDVLSSKSGDNLVNKIVDFVDQEKELNEDIKKLLDLRHTIIDEIMSLSDSRYTEILFKRYVEYKHFENIACEMSITYEWARHLHIEALNCFDEEVKTTHKNTFICDKIVS